MGDLNKEIEVDEDKVTEFALPEPDVVALTEQYRQSLSDAAAYYQEQAAGEDTRFTRWQGQSVDSRKRSSVLGHRPFPWDGAADMRVPIADDSVNTIKAIILNAVNRANIKAISSSNTEDALVKSALATNFIKWLVKSQMTEFPREIEKCVDYYCSKGVAAINTFWDRRAIKRNITVTIDEIIAQIAQAASQVSEDPAVVQESVALFMKKLNDEMFTDEIAGGLKAQYPDNSDKKLRRAVKDLRTGGSCILAKLIMTVNRPGIKAYALDVNLTVPVYSRDCDEIPMIFETRFFTPMELREKVLTNGWNADWVEDVIERTKGMMDPDMGQISSIYRSQTMYSPVQSAQEAMTSREYCKIIFCYQKLSDEDGISDVYLTVFSPYLGTEPGENTEYGFHSILDFAQGEYPFVFVKRENTSDRLLDSRGLSNLGRDAQNEIKVLRDSRLDLASMQIFPPMYYPSMDKPPVYAPGALIPTMPNGMGEIRQHQVAGDAGTSIEIENTVMSTWDRYAGLQKDASGQYTAESLLKQQANINIILEMLKKVLNQIMNLWIVYGDKETYFRVIGASQEQIQTFEITSDDEKYDFYLDFNVNTQDTDAMLQRAKIISELAPLDKDGTLNGSELIKMCIQSIDPVLASTIITPKDTAYNQEIAAELDALTKAYAGVDQDVKPNSNHELALQVMQNYLKGTDVIPAADVQRKLQADPEFAARIQKRMEQHQFAITQQKNAQIGRMGTKPATYNGSPM